MRQVVGGQPIYLRARFKDDLGVPVQATAVELYIYPPDTTEFEPVNAFSGPETPEYLGDGIFEFEFIPPVDGPEGVWFDAWAGTVNLQVIESTMTFYVGVVGDVEMLEDSQLRINQVVTVSVPTTLLAEDGSHLASAYQFDFMTRIAPAYTSIRKLMLSAGSFLSGLDDDVLQTAILEASIGADVMRFSSTISNTTLFEHARREYATCMAIHMLISNLLRSPLKSKTLDNLSVSYDTNGLRDALKQFEDCMKSWETPIQSGAAPVGVPKMVIKGAADPDRPNIGRDWETTSESDHPVGNGYVNPSGSRRWFKTRIK